jgi:uncharacterized membrane protein
MNQSASIQFKDAGRGAIRSDSARKWGALIGGGVLAIYGFSRRSPSGIALAAAGGTLAYLGANQKAFRSEPTTVSSILMNCSPQDAYRFWRDFDNLPRFMHHLEDVNVLDDRRSHWTALGPMGRKVEWDAEIVEDRENELIAWRSLPGSDVQMDGRVEFREAPADRGTIIRAVVHFRPPGGVLGSSIARFLSKNANFIMRQDLRRLEALLESGEIPTVEGQSHGPRDFATAVFRVADPDRPVRGSSNLAEVFEARRRAS